MIAGDLLAGKKRYSEFLTSPERITTNILAQRLAQLEGSGLARKALYQERPKRYEYELTEKGEALRVFHEQAAGAARHGFVKTGGLQVSRRSPS